MKKLIVLLVFCFSHLAMADSCREVDGQEYWYGKKSSKGIQTMAIDLAITVAQEKCVEMNGVAVKIIKAKKMGCSKECARKNNSRDTCTRKTYICSAKATIKCCPKF